MSSAHISAYFFLFWQDQSQQAYSIAIQNCSYIPISPCRYNTSAYTSKMDFCFLCTYPFKFSSAVCITDKPFWKGFGSLDHSIYSNASDLTVFDKFCEHVILNGERTIRPHTCTISCCYK